MQEDSQSQVSDDLVICLPPDILPLIMNSFMFIYLRWSGETRLRSHPGTGSLSEAQDSGFGRKGLRVLRCWILTSHFYMMTSLWFLLTERILYPTHDLRACESEELSVIISFKVDFIHHLLLRRGATSDLHQNVHTCVCRDLTLDRFVLWLLILKEKLL